MSFANKVEELRTRFGFDHCFSVDRVGRSGGLAILWKNNFHCEITSYSRNHIDLNVLDNGSAGWRLTCFYGFPERERRSDSWQFIHQLASRSSLPWCIMGDFNDLLYATDKQGRIEHPQSLFTGFHNTIEECQLIEIDLNGGNFTREKSRGTSNWVRERLDRASATQSWWSKFPLCYLKVFQVSRSDHDPIILELMKVDILRKNFRFRFENIWLKEPNFVTEVKDFWKSIPVAHLIPKLAEVSAYMARWGRTFFHKFKEKIKVQKNIMESLGNRTDADSVQGYLEANEELNNLFYKEEVY